MSFNERLAVRRQLPDQDAPAVSSPPRPMPLASGKMLGTPTLYAELTV
jgi:hypothetical protein